MLTAGNGRLIGTARAPREDDNEEERGVSVTMSESMSGINESALCSATVVPASDTALQGGERVSLASAHLVGIGCDLGPTASASAAAASGPRVVVTVPIEPTELGGGNCTPVRNVFRPLPPREEACVAGCCTRGQCVCRAGFTGDRCDLELRCAVVPEGASRLAMSIAEGGSGSGSDETACMTDIDAIGSRLSCTCVPMRVGMVAVVQFRITPANNLFTAHRGRLPLVRPSSLLIWAAALAAYALVVAVAVRIDAGTQYLAAQHPGVPAWLRPRPFSLAAEVLFTLRLRTSIARIWYVYPGHTLYTRAQLLHVLACSLAFSYFSVSVFMGRADENCNHIANLIATVAVTVSSILGTVIRILFRCANLRKGRHIGRVYHANKAARNALKGTREGGGEKMLPSGVRSEGTALEGSPVGMKAPRRQQGGGKRAEGSPVGKKAAPIQSYGLPSSKSSPPPSPPPSLPRQMTIAEVQVELGRELSSGESTPCGRSPTQRPPPRLIGTREHLGHRGAGAKPRARAYIDSEGGGSPSTGSHEKLLQARGLGAPRVHHSGSKCASVAKAEGGGDSRGRSGQPTLARLNSVTAQHLSLDPTYAVAVGFCVRANGQSAFVPASHIGGSLFSRRLTIGYEGAALPAGASEPNRSNVIRSQHGLRLGGSGGLGGLAWAFNGALLVGATFGSMLVLESRALPSPLQASAVDEQSWYASVRETYILSLVQSLLLVDLLKVLCLTLTSEPMLARVGLKKRGRKCLGKPIRRLHKVLEFLL